MELQILLLLSTLDLLHNVPASSPQPIIGGIPDDRHLFKYYVSIHEKDEDEEKYNHVCSGTIISERHVLTAAHCFMTMEDDVALDAVQIANGGAKILAGTTRLHGPGVERDVVKVYIPGHFSMGEFNTADIAVVLLNADLGVSQNPSRLQIMPVGGPYPRDYEAGKHASFCGHGAYKLSRERYGLVANFESVPEVKQCLGVIVLGRQECEQYVAAICARSFDRRTVRTSCKGDSGAGLIFENHVVGVLTRGPELCNSNDVPIVFSRASLFRSFIQRATDEDADHGDMHVLAAEGESPTRNSRQGDHRRLHGRLGVRRGNGLRWVQRARVSSDWTGGEVGGGV